MRRNWYSVACSWNFNNISRFRELFFSRVNTKYFKLLELYNSRLVVAPTRPSNKWDNNKDWLIIAVSVQWRWPVYWNIFAWAIDCLWEELCTCIRVLWFRLLIERRGEVSAYDVMLYLICRIQYLQPQLTIKNDVVTEIPRIHSLNLELLIGLYFPAIASKNVLSAAGSMHYL